MLGGLQDIQVLHTHAVSSPAGTNDRTEVTNRDVTHIIIGCQEPGAVDKVTLSVEHQTADGRIEQLKTSIPVRFEAEVSSLFGGQDVNSLQLDIEGDAAAASLRKKLGVAIDIGFVRLRIGDKLIVKTEVTSALGAAELVTVMAAKSGVLFGERTHRTHMHDGDRNVLVRDARAVYAFRRTAAAEANEASSLTGAKLTATVNVNGQRRVLTGDALFFAGMALGRIGDMGPKQTVVIWADPACNEGVSNIEVALTGTDVADWTIVSETYVTDVARAAQTGAAAVAEQARRVAAQEDEDPELAKSARYQGRLPRSEDLAEMVLVRSANIPGSTGGKKRPTPELRAGAPRLAQGGKTIKAGYIKSGG